MKMRTKIQAAALFAGIIFLNVESPEVEMKYFEITVPSQALLNLTLDAAAHLSAAPKAAAESAKAS